MPIVKKLGLQLLIPVIFLASANSQDRALFFSEYIANGYTNALEIIKRTADTSWPASGSIWYLSNTALIELLKDGQVPLSEFTLKGVGTAQFKNSVINAGESKTILVKM